MDEVRAHFPPEFLNRLDDVILFHRLKESEIRKIVDIQLKPIQRAAGGAGHRRSRSTTAPRRSSRARATIP